jgi:two-component system NtrC family response regulator
MSRKKVLVVEDDPGLQRQLRWGLDAYDVQLAGNAELAMAQLRRHQPPVVTMDLGLPPDPQGASVGLALLQDILGSAPETKIIIMSGNQDRANVLKAIAIGAYDFLHKPVDVDVLLLMVERAHFLHTVQGEHQRMLQIEADSPLNGIISRDAAMLKLCRVVEKVAPSSASIMLLGESGCGKEVLARGIHRLSGRHAKAFVAINCAAIPEHLLESELFGHEKGAFTGADRQAQGKIELAHGGTFFLDEIGDMAPALQGKLLRFLQERVIERVGGRREIPVDVRVVCATHRNLQAQVEQGLFREDLYYRLNEIALSIPPLRERSGDPALLAHHFKNRCCAGSRRQLQFHPEALAAIEAHCWPGNVRELENCVRRAVIMAEGPLITRDDLGLTPAGVETEDNINLRLARDAAEYRVMVKALGRVNGNILRAAELLGISRPTLYDLMNHHGIR